MKTASSFWHRPVFNAHVLCVLSFQRKTTSVAILAKNQGRRENPALHSFIRFSVIVFSFVYVTCPSPKMDPNDTKHSSRELGRSVLLCSIPDATRVVSLVRFSRIRENVTRQKYYRNPRHKLTLSTLSHTAHEQMASRTDDARNAKTPVGARRCPAKAKLLDESQLLKKQLE